MKKMEKMEVLEKLLKVGEENVRVSLLPKRWTDEAFYSVICRCLSQWCTGNEKEICLEVSFVETNDCEDFPRKINYCGTFEECMTAIKGNLFQTVGVRVDLLFYGKNKCSYVIVR